MTCWKDEAREHAAVTLPQSTLPTQFALAGLKPAGDNGSYMQKVPMVGVTPDPQTTFLCWFPPTMPRNLKPLDQYVAYDQTQQPQSDVDAQIVYVGYGIEAPEYKWDDYKGVDVRGKVLLMLVNEPPSDDVKFFKGKGPDLLRALDLQV